MDKSEFTRFTASDLDQIHSKTLYRSICVPSTVQAYSLCIEYVKQWFLSKFNKDYFKSIYVEGKNIYDDFRSLSKVDLIKRQKPSLTITPSFSWDFNDENIDAYPYGMELYTQTGMFKNSFFSCKETDSYLGIGLETILMPFNFRIRLETRAQQLDLYKFIKMACRVGFTCGEDTNLDFHIPYPLMIQLAKDNGFTTTEEKLDGKVVRERINEIPRFLHWLNSHSVLPFLYKHRTLNGNNEFFLRMTNMYVHLRPTDISADDGEREGQMTNNFAIELSVEVRFPAPKMYAYYSNNEHELNTIYSSWFQTGGPVSNCYTFKEIEIPETNRYGWDLYMSTTYEDDDFVLTESKLNIDLSELLEGDIGRCIVDCIEKGISPSIFCEFLFYNGAEYITGNFDWESLKFESDELVRSPNTYIGIYVDKAYIANYIASISGSDRVNKS